MNSTALTRSIIQKPISVTAELVVSAAHDELAKAPKADGKVAEVAQVVDRSCIRILSRKRIMLCRPFLGRTLR